MKTILTSKNQSIMIDDEDFDFLNTWKWHLNNKGYATRTIRNGKKWGHPLLHRVLLNVTDKQIQVDHIDGNPLNNQKSNLRLVNSQQNHFNSFKTKKKVCYSKYKGVTYNKRNKKWNAKYCLNKKTIWIGSFKTEIEAALAYNSTVKIIFGEFAKLNNVKEQKSIEIGSRIT